MLLTAELGEDLVREGTTWRIVRISKQDSLVDSGAKLEVVSEHLLELISGDGRIRFEVLSSSRADYAGPGSSIRPPEALVWKEN